MDEVPDEYLAEILPLAKKIAKALGVVDYNILQVGFRTVHFVSLRLTSSPIRTMARSRTSTSSMCISMSSPSPTRPKVWGLAGRASNNRRRCWPRPSKKSSRSCRANVTRCKTALSHVRIGGGMRSSLYTSRAALSNLYKHCDAAAAVRAALCELLVESGDRQCSPKTGESPTWSWNVSFLYPVLDATHHSSITEKVRNSKKTSCNYQRYRRAALIGKFDVLNSRLVI